MGKTTFNDTIVLIPHFNNPDGLLRSINSVSVEEEVDVLIVDDGSTAKLDENKISNNYRAHGKVFFIFLEKNQGIERALNQGLKYVVNSGQYQFVARLDCGDVCHADRFHLQRQFLELNPDIYLIGTFVEFVDISGNFLYSLKLPTKHEEIEKKMYFNCMFIHPSVMFRVKAVKEKVGYYPLNYDAAEDYAYFFRFLKYYKTANIDQVLVKCELNPKGLSSKKRRRQVLSRIKIIFENFKFNYFAIMGIFRNSILLVLPINLINLLKKLLWNAK